MTEVMTGISLSDVARQFRRSDGVIVDAVRDVNVVIRDGEFVAILGPSGCGKTTLLQMVAGLLPPSTGDILVRGQSVTGPSPERGVVFQRDSVFPWMRVIANVEYGLRCRGIGKTEREHRAREYLHAVGLEGFEGAWPKELSGGMLKRVAVATVFANDARVLLLDEPFGALDYVTKRQLHQVLLELWAQSSATDGRRTVMFVTHDVEEALILADRILVMHSGQVVEDVTLALPRPRTTEVLATVEAVELKHVLLGHLGLERLAPNVSLSATPHGGAIHRS